MSGNASLIDLLAAMDRLQASDLFVTEGKVPMVRVHGSIHPIKQPVTTVADIDALLDVALVGPARQRYEAEGDLDTGLSLQDGRRYRINLHRSQGVRGLVARAVPGGDLDLDELGLPAGVAALADLPRGLVLVTGATGSGKSTTLAAMVSRINHSRRGHIVTIEDPVEYTHSDDRCRISQREVGSDTMSFAAALKEVVRQSPDVIVIGEMRDSETMRVAVTAALTGHLVLASLHTIDATQTLQRILSYFPDDTRAQVAMDLSMSLAGIVSQRLLPRADGRGRVVAVELITSGPASSRLIREQRVDELYDLMRSSEGGTMVTFNRSLLDLYQRGHIDYETGLGHATNRDEFALQARGMNTGVGGFRSSDSGANESDLDMQTLLQEVLDQGASDLHLTTGRPPILRVAGELVPLDWPPLSDSDMRILLFSILSGRQRSEYELDREIDFALALDGGRRFRVNAYFQKGRMAAALRAIPAGVPGAVELGLPETVLSLGRRRQGLLLVVGPTGSGKSTTLACLVDRINQSRACRIMTIEDPIEYTHDALVATVDQREVHADTRSFAAALKFILRQDPDVIMVGEMRDLETISSALTAAETGHLVLATLHANDAIQAIDRIIDVFPPYQQAQTRAQLAAALLGVVSQRLLPQREGDGRVAAFEVMVATSAIRNIIREDKRHQAGTVMEGARRDGMVTMDRAVRQLYASGQIHYEDALRYVTNPRTLQRRPEDAEIESPDPSAGAYHRS
jgi:pilus retraction protein PilT